VGVSEMWKGLVLIVGLVTGAAHAADLPEEPRPAPIDAPLTAAGPFGGGRGPLETAGDEMEEKKSEKELELEERLKEIEEATAARIARVVVLQWKGTDTTYKNESLQRNIKARIARPDAQFYPEIDLYQSGRKEPDKTVRHTDQRAIVPEAAVPTVLDAVEDVSAIPWNALSEQDWGLKANDLLNLSNEIWFVDRAELREPLFLLYTYIGYAAENANNPSPPYFEQVGGRTVNYYWYLAGALAHQDPALMSKLTDQSLNASVNFYKDQLDAGQFESLTLSFDLDDLEFDPKAFATEYEVYVNGNLEVIKNPDGLLKVPLGRVDVYLKRADGHSLSDRIDLDRLTDKFYFVRRNAKKKMGLDFQDQLMTHPYECTPPLDGDILNYLSIYAKLHPQAEVYIAVPYAGSTAPGRIFLWRWDRPNGTLVRVQDNTGGFPVRFAAVFSAGLVFSTFDVQNPTEEDLEQLVTQQQPGQPFSPLQAGDSLLPNFDPVIDGVPLDWQLRGHYNRLLMAVGLQFKVGLNGQGSFTDLYQTNGNTAVKVVSVPCGPDDLQPECQQTDENPNPERPAQIVALRQRALQRLVYTTIGVVLGKDASVGFGPRGYLRVGWYNAPHAVDITGHLGWTPRIGAKDRKDEERTGRVRALLDVDFFGGVIAPVQDSLYVYRRQFFAVGPPFATFGFTAGAGLTF
jgi:hypothetical protein